MVSACRILAGLTRLIVFQIYMIKLLNLIYFISQIRTTMLENYKPSAAYSHLNTLTPSIIYSGGPLPPSFSSL